jgi:hypothetical protein
MDQKTFLCQRLSSRPRKDLTWSLLRRRLVHFIVFRSLSMGWIPCMVSINNLAKTALISAGACHLALTSSKWALVPANLPLNFKTSSDKGIPFCTDLRNPTAV